VDVGHEVEKEGGGEGGEDVAGHSVDWEARKLLIDAG
jgi:hypothetical protein